MAFCAGEPAGHFDTNYDPPDTKCYWIYLVHGYLQLRVSIIVIRFTNIASVAFFCDAIYTKLIIQFCV